MSIEVRLDELAEVVAERGPDAYLVTIREDRPHVVSVSVTVRADRELVVAAGRRTAMNVVDHPAATLLWPVTDAHPKHTLLVDGTATMSDDGEWLAITPTSAILHRAGGRRRAPRLDGGAAGDGGPRPSE